MNIRRVGLIALALMLLGLGATLWKATSSQTKDAAAAGSLAAFSLQQRPQADRHLFDYAGVLAHYAEGAQAYLGNLSKRHRIEAVIVSLPHLPDGHSISTLAADLLNNWQIGAAQDGRGLLLLLVDDTHQVKLEVAYALEDVFTDSFAGFVEDVELGPYYRRGDVGTGLIAVMELLEERGQVKSQGEYTLAQIAQADARLLSGGAGATRRLSRYAADKTVAIEGSGRGADSPESAWETMLIQWDGRGSNIETDIYTAMTRRAMGDPNAPDPRTQKSLRHWQSADFQVLSDGAHAVIWFGAKDGWDNAPFLFCNTGDGWRFDIVHQRRLVIMAEAPRWQVSQGPYPYPALMPKAHHVTSKDLPLQHGDLYRCSDDAAIEQRMRELESELAQNPDATNSVLELLRLNVITGQRPNLIMPLIEKAKQLAPRTPETFKYASIYHVNAFFQYETALKEIERYQDLLPNDPFAYRMKGFLLYRLGRYTESIEVLDVAIELDSGDDYTYGLMARDYALLARQTTGSEKRSHQTKARDMRDKAANVSPPGSQRLAWLDRWLQARLG